MSGGASGHTRGDVIHTNGIYCEIKYRKRLSIIQLVADTRKKAKLEKKLPVVAITQENHQGFILLIHSDDFEEVATRIMENRSENGE